MSNRRNHPIGEIRQSQVITTFGPGSMLDLPNHSVLVSGLESWHGNRTRIHEERLEGWLRDRLQLSELKLYAPPIDSDSIGDRATGIPVIPFPGWFLAQVEATWEVNGRVYRTRPLIPAGQLTRGGYQDINRKIQPVVPVRFVQACVRGHISDIDWYAFVRDDLRTPHTGQLWFDEGGAGNDFAEIFVRDEQTGRRRPLSDATGPSHKVLGRCSGAMPWLGPRIWEECDQHNRLLTRSASNAYFSQTMGVISIPDKDAALRSAVDQVWEDHLSYLDDLGDLRKERKREKVAAALTGLADEEVWAEVERRLKRLPVPDKGIKEAELDTLLVQTPSIGRDRPDGDFFARSCALGTLPIEAEGKLDRLVLVHRLREVVVQLGFTRFDTAYTGIDGELDLDVKLAPLSREPDWLPAYENRGEGIFFSVSKAAMEAWLVRPGVKARGERLLRGHEAWQRRKERERPFPGLPYIMLHSLSHLLITALALDCGYSASSIRERIYSGESGYGILLYTAAPGAEGTLGGLVEMGRSLGRHLSRALDLGRLCSNDPVCAHHDPASVMEERYLHGAACHGCLLIAETSCERRNDLLDRALVVPTVDTPDAAFFCEVP